MQLKKPAHHKNFRFPGRPCRRRYLCTKCIRSLLDQTEIGTEFYLPTRETENTPFSCPPNGNVSIFTGFLRHRKLNFRCVCKSIYLPYYVSEKQRQKRIQHTGIFCTRLNFKRQFTALLNYLSDRALTVISRLHKKPNRVKGLSRTFDVLFFFFYVRCIILININVIICVSTRHIIIHRYTAIMPRLTASFYGI